MHRQKQTLLPGGTSVDDISGISSAKTTAKPLEQTLFSASVDDSDHLRGEMPVNMAMEEPRPGVIGHKTNRDIISLIADADYVTQDRVVPVIGTVPCTANNIERMAVEMDGMLTRCHT
jgi:hypothetical protein